MRCALLSLFVFAFLGACDSQEYAQCNAPDDHLEVLYKAKNPVHPFSHPFCLVCNTEIEADEYASWAESMGGSGDISSPEGLHPCLYVYGEGADIPSLEACQALVCDGGAIYNDMVSKTQGNVNVGPILDPDNLISHEWVLSPQATTMNHSLPLTTDIRATTVTQVPQ